jgi:6-pyruvoyltetrahydropterin/6-carboxytetrahydropterin synthase
VCYVRPMFSLAVRDHVMIAHSFRGAVFGPAQRLHGATYVVDVEVRTPELDRDGLVIDIGILSRELSAALEPWRFQNLDELPELAGRNTTTEFLAHLLHTRLAARLRALHADGTLAALPAAMKISFHESHVAWAAYDGPL